MKYIKLFESFTSNLTQEQLRLVQSKEFKDWFGASKVVDENGEPLIMYHGTDTVFDKFDTKKRKNYLGEKDLDAIFFTDQKWIAQGMGTNFETPEKTIIMSAFISIQNPLTNDVLGIQPNDKMPFGGMDVYEQNNKKILKLMKTGKYDGIILRGMDAKFEQVVVFDDTKIKLI